MNTSIEFRPFDKKTREQYLDLCQFAFGMPNESRNRYVTEDYELANSLGAFDGDKLAAGMWYFAFDMRVRNTFVPMAGVAAVATWPEYRNRGLVKAILLKSQEKMRAEGRPVSVLAPFKHSFYQAAGWGHTFDVLVASFEPGKIRNLPDEEYRIHLANGPDEWETFEMLNTRFGERYNGPVCRDKLYWTRRYFEQVGANRYSYLVEKNGEPHGYFIYRFVQVGFEEQVSQIRVLQTVWLNPGVQRAIFRYLGTLRDQVKTIIMYLPPDVRLDHLFDNPMIELKLVPKMMTKLVDAPRALERIDYAPDLNGDVTLNILGDETAPWNTGQFRIHFQGGNASVEAVPSAKEAVKLTIQNLSALYMGYHSVDELIQQNAIAGPSSSLELLASAFPRRATYIDDWF
jgi:predicted acetyltransferase